ncbi:substrate-binding domain-containing protein [Actinoplanes sp. L3-i22]|uniref:substrate-binding domain-containing protein n=1 Tax=Actinoplanes sp. L3-i22 TaxID=2836373 RepID=UPI001C84EAA5|nr:substrate-binding domain-containing protein [Actinoplanes sp. L3-i22]
MSYESPAYAGTATQLTGGGDTVAATAVDQWAAELGMTGLRINYNGVGSRAGLTQFGSDLTDFAVTDVPFDTPPARPFAYVPMVGDAVDLAYTVTAGGRRLTDLRLSEPALAGIFTGTITRWNDPAIAADNPGVALPGEVIRPVIRSDANGTTLAFTSWLAARRPAAWADYCGRAGQTTPCGPTSLYPYAGGDFTALAGAQNSAGFARETEGAIAYVDHHTARAIGNRVARIGNAAGIPTAPAATSIAIGLTRAGVATDGTADLQPVYANPDPRAYPLAYYHSLVVPTATSARFPAAAGGALTRFGGFAICAGQEQVDQLGYAPLPINLTRAAIDRLGRVPGADPAALQLSTCANPTFRPDGTTILDTAPYPPSPDLTELITTTVEAGTLTVSVETGDVVLPAPVLTADGEALTTSGDIRTVTVTDTRAGNPGWNVSGQITDFTDGAAHTIPAERLAWTPAVVDHLPFQHVTAGPGAVLGRPATLGSGDNGTARLGAHIVLNAPTETLPGTYSALLTFTAI